MTLLYADCGSRFFVVHNTEKTWYERTQSTAGVHTPLACTIITKYMPSVGRSGVRQCRVLRRVSRARGCSGKHDFGYISTSFPPWRFGSAFVGILSRKERLVDWRRSLSNFSPIQWNLPLNGQLINLSLKFIPIFQQRSFFRFDWRFSEFFETIRVTTLPLLIANDLRTKH